MHTPRRLSSSKQGMHIVIYALGSRGDVQPLIALAIGLKQAGNRVTLATSHTYADWIQSCGVDSHPVRFDPYAILNHPEMQAFMQKGGNPLRVFRVMRQGLARALGAHDEFWQVAQTADYVVQTSTSVGALEAAEKLDLPSAIAHLFPITPTRAFPSFFLGRFRFSLGAGYNWLTHVAMLRIVWTLVGAPLTNQWRRKLGLRAWRSYGDIYAHARRWQIPILCCFSPAVLPKPPDWDEYHHVTGYWFLSPPPAWQPPAELVRFLESGPPPVYVGFGSMDAGDGEERVRMVLRALELSRQRGIIVAGRGGLARRAEVPSVLCVEDVPHDWLFPRMAAVVHHGGAGSTGASLRAGVPSIIAPVAADQHAWAEQAVRLGVGPPVPELKSLTAEKLAGAIRTAIVDSDLRTCAAQFGETIRAENGVAEAVQIIERHAARFRRP
jgi:UDP:flavonoid glycosyltransferase YjiC (YdhE family)